MDKKNVIIGILSVICLILAYLAFKPVAPIDNTFIKARIDSIAVENKKLLAGADNLLKANEVLKALNDSLLKLPPKIKTKYLTVYQTIDKLDTKDVKDTLNSIFVQNKVDTARKDTMLYISPSESKFLINQYYRNGELIELNKVCEDVNGNLLKELKNDSLAISDYKVVIKNDNELSSLKESEIQNLNTVIKGKNKIILRQKIFKWVAISAGIIGTSYMSYYRIVKSLP